MRRVTWMPHVIDLKHSVSYCFNEINLGGNFNGKANRQARNPQGEPHRDLG
jgi:hypothetical protein